MLFYILIGNHNLTEEDNTVIFEAVHTFIRTSTRFDDLAFNNYTHDAKFRTCHL